MREYSSIWWRRSSRPRPLGGERAAPALTADAEAHADLESRHARKLIRRRLGYCEAATAGTLARQIGVSEDLVRREIESMVAGSEVEAIRPVHGGAGGADLYYRLRRETDRDHAWEREITIRLPLSRLAQLRGWEREAADAPPAWIAAEVSAYGV